MQFTASEEWLRRMAETEDGANVCIGSLPPISFEDAGECVLFRKDAIAT